VSPNPTLAVVRTNIGLVSTLRSRTGLRLPRWHISCRQPVMSRLQSQQISHVSAARHCLDY